MESKIQKIYVDNGFGFPVHLHNVKMIKVRGQWTPDINYAKLSDMVFKSLAVKKSRLTGNELKFMRQKFEMTLTEFADKFYVTHPAVLKWENCGNDPTNMKWVTEKDIRLSIVANTENNLDFLSVYKQLRSRATNRKHHTKVSIKKKEMALV